MSTGTQNLVGLGGAGLVFANFWLGNDKGTVADGLFGSGSSSSAHSVLAKLGGEMLLVVVLTVLAGVSDGWATLMVVVVLGLWLVWGINKYGGGTSASASSKGALA